jgi:tight adherence protein B
VTTAALALAAALLVWPAAPRRLRERPRRPWRRPSAVVVAVLMVLAWVVPVPVAVAAGVVAGTVALRRRRRTIQGRRAAESVALQSALEVLVGELRVGAHPVTAFTVAAGEVSGRVADGMRAVAARARLGADVAAGLDDVASVSPLPMHWQRLAVCWRLAETRGLAVATLMQTAAQDIVERERFSSRVTAAMAGARTTAAMLAGLPVIGIALGQLIGAEPVAFLLAPGVGGWLLVVGVLLACTGLLWSDRIVAGALR